MRTLLVSALLLAAGCCTEQTRTVTPAPQPVAVAPAPLAAPKKVEEDPHTRVSICARGDDVRDVCAEIARQAGVNIVVEPGIKATVDLTLRDVDWLVALETVADFTKCEVSVLRNGVRYVIDPPRVTLSTY
ncbi:MAG TPA: hypothetical protein VFF73_12230 [Planctomycetota bacterium]|nr:hypothetical protein [Planctomycetota bacterium]